VVQPIELCGYTALATDRYPPFTPADVPEYLAGLNINYPQQLNVGCRWSSRCSPSRTTSLWRACRLRYSRTLCSLAHSRSARTRLVDRVSGRERSGQSDQRRKEQIGLSWSQDHRLCARATVLIRTALAMSTDRRGGRARWTFAI
jgi:hypothetical protein